VKLIESAHSVIGTDVSANAAVWLHGLGADGYDFVPIVPRLVIPPPLSVRFVFRTPRPARHTQRRHAHARLVRSYRPGPH
jgi:predicted esterase